SWQSGASDRKGPALTREEESTRILLRRSAASAIRRNAGSTLTSGMRQRLCAEDGADACGPLGRPGGHGPGGGWWRWGWTWGARVNQARPGESRAGPCRVPVATGGTGETVNTHTLVESLILAQDQRWRRA